MAYRSFEELEVWKRACRLAVDVYEHFRHCRDYALKDQVTRSVVSIASNIAEGAERDSEGDFVRFLNIAKASAAELRTQIYIASRVGMLDKESGNAVITELRELSAMLRSLAKTIKRTTEN